MSAHPRLSLNQATIKHAPLADALDVAARAGYRSFGVWREPVAELGLERAARLVRSSGLRVSSLCRAGFFTAPSGPARRAALDDNRRAIDETAVLAEAGAPGSAAVLVLVAGGLPDGDRDLVGARSRAADAIAELLPVAVAAGVTLAIEPMHPMFAADRGVVSTLGQALDLAEELGPEVGVVVDTYHVWWDPQLPVQLARAGASGRIASYQVCDWMTPLSPDALLSRGYLGDGHVDFDSVTRLVREAGYAGDVEVEIFRQEIWESPWAQVARIVAERFGALVAPALES